MKIICSDYDGTLNHGGISGEKLDSIKKWQKAGNLFSIVSGRDKEFFLELKERNIPIDYYLACNGAVILDSKGKIISDTRCDGEIILPLIEFLFSQDCSFANICSHISFRIKNGSFPEEKGEDIVNAVQFSYFNQISTALPTFEEAALVTEKIHEKLGEYVNPLQNGTCIDIVPFGMDKAQGIYKLTDAVKLRHENVICVGDNVNDEAMIKEFYSYAMENGVERIKTLADNITKSIEELIEREI